MVIGSTVEKCDEIPSACVLQSWVSFRKVFSCMTFKTYLGIMLAKEMLPCFPCNLYCFGMNQVLFIEM